VIDDDVRLEYDIIDAFAGPDKLGRSASHKPRLHHNNTADIQVLTTL